MADWQRAIEARLDQASDLAQLSWQDLGRKPMNPLLERWDGTEDFP